MMYSNPLTADTVIIGGGAAGSICAITAANHGDNVIIIEPNKKIGRKLRITGKGRCNLTNSCSIENVLKNINGNNKFLYSSLNNFDTFSVINFFESLGVPTKVERGNRVFPISDNANDIADALSNKINELNIRVIQEKALNIDYNNSYVIGVKTQNHNIKTSKCVVCTGGMSYPLTGSTGDGYRFAKDAGHNVINCRPSLVPLESDDYFCSQLQGVSLKNIKLTAYENNKVIYCDIGEMMFTHFGITGPLVLSASAHMRDFINNDYHIELDLKPGLDEVKLNKRILRDFDKNKNKEISNVLNELTLKSLIPIILKKANINGNQVVNSITKEQRQALINVFKSFSINIYGTRPFDEAIVTSGGIDLKEINPRTMESKIIKGLYFAGEVLNLDAYTGGYNLQIAWSTGYTAGLK